MSLDSVVPTRKADDFRPSPRLQQPQVMLAMNVVAADTDAEAVRLFTTQQQSFVNLRRGRPGLVPPPLASVAAFDEYCTPDEKAGVDAALACAAVGAPDTVRAAMQRFVERHRPDELMLTANVFDHAARVRSFVLAMEAWQTHQGRRISSARHSSESWNPFRVCR